MCLLRWIHWVTLLLRLNKERQEVLQRKEMERKKPVARGTWLFRSTGKGKHQHSRAQGPRQHGGTYPPSVCQTSLRRVTSKSCNRVWCMWLCNSMDVTGRARSLAGEEEDWWGRLNGTRAREKPDKTVGEGEETGSHELTFWKVNVTVMNCVYVKVVTLLIYCYKKYVIWFNVCYLKLLLYLLCIHVIIRGLTCIFLHIYS